MNIHAGNRKKDFRQGQQVSQLHRKLTVSLIIINFSNYFVTNGVRRTGFKLREWRSDDIESLQKNANNKNVSQFLRDRFPFPYTIDDAIEWTNLMKQQTALINFAIEVDGQPVGGIGFEQRSDIFRKTFELGYWLGESYHGRGIMPQAVKLMVDYAFATFDIIRIQAGVFSNNPRSMRVLEKCEFIKEGVLKNSVVKDNAILDEHIFAIYKAW